MEIILVKDWKRKNGQIIKKKTVVDVYRTTAILMIERGEAILVESNNQNDMMFKVLKPLTFLEKTYKVNDLILIPIKYEADIENFIKNEVIEYIVD